MEPLYGAWLEHHFEAAKKAREAVPTEAICARVLAANHPNQRAFAEDPNLLIAAVIARGGGKTTGGRTRFLLRMLRVPKARCLFIATTRGQAEEFMWEPLKELCAALDIPAKFQETKLKCTFLHNGSTLRLVGADDKKEVGKLRGQPFHEVGIDEGASYPDALLKNLIYRIIQPRLGDFDGKLWIIGTPGHLLVGLFYELTRIGSELSVPFDKRTPDCESWSYHHWTLKDGAQSVPAMRKLWAAAVRNKRVNKWSDDNPIWKREYLGLWAGDDTENVFKYRAHLDDGTPWNQWDPELNPLGFAKLPKQYGEWQYSYGMDLGESDPFALEIFAWSPHDPDKNLYHVYEHIHEGTMYSKKLAELLIGEPLRAESPEGCIGHSGWPTGLVADMAGLGGAILKEVEEVYGVKILPAAKKDKHDAISMFNGDLIDGRTKILKGSALEMQLVTLQWLVDEYNRMKENPSMRNDATDAAVYARREAFHLHSKEQDAKKPYFPPKPDMMLVPDEDDEDEFSEYVSDDDYDDYMDVFQ